MEHHASVPSAQSYIRDVAQLVEHEGVRGHAFELLHQLDLVEGHFNKEIVLVRQEDAPISFKDGFDFVVKPQELVLDDLVRDASEVVANEGVVVDYYALQNVVLRVPLVNDLLQLLKRRSQNLVLLLVAIRLEQGLHQPSHQALAIYMVQ